MCRANDMISWVQKEERTRSPFFKRFKRGVPVKSYFVDYYYGDSDASSTYGPRELYTVIVW